ncbi:alpha/beta hydrolase [Halarcobacter ebronensis]|uniref:Alpha/beta hydrolase n=1 Tax=Halarcobacter ebronensis TaxID=1462615 RepID=A0A4Q1ALF0_9BACT|nr:alpha/beta fold hydrolase [Halarcobacter ebronensis]QKF82106.1 putative esterase (alpha/beta hydrolase domain) [Halarcobacter ebronensis]RXJ70179.1 alpha/beta hydrolase [Halarcobacter ebronensis]RXK04065.1 alpha/beta hydrolase [Halarcobacter ebronensis]
MINRIFLVLIFIVFSLSLEAKKISESECLATEENFIYAGGECVEYRAYKGDSDDKIIIIVHGTWDEGTNTLGRYAPFAETLNMNTDITTVAVALPGYSNSSTNNFTALSHEGVKNLAAKKEYVEFLGDLVNELKEKFEAKEVTYVGHSAGAMMGATLTGLRPGLIQNIALAGGRYDIHQTEKGNDLISFIDVIDNVDKNTKYLFIYGSEDKISKPEVTTSFFKIAKEKGLNAKLIKVEGAEHLDLDMTNTSIDAITKMVEGE